MRVLGIDPGLTRCGMGVVEGQVGASADAGRRRRAAHLGRPAGGPAAGDDREGHRRLARRVPPRTRSPSSGSSPAPRQHGHGHRPGQRHRDGRGGSAWAAGRAAHARARSRRPSPAAAAPTRPRSGRWSPGSSGWTHPRSPPTPPTRSPSPSATSGAVAHRRASTPRWPPPYDRTGAPHDDRLRPRPGRRRHAGQRRPGGRGSGPGAEVHPRHPGHAPERPAGHAADQHGRARGLPDPVRLPRRGREGDLRARADRQRAWGRSWPRPCWRCWRPTTCAGRSPATTSRPSPGCPASARRVPSGSSSSSRTGSAPRSAAGPRPGPRPPPRGETRCTGPGGPGLVDPDADQAVDAVAPEAGEHPRRGRAAARRAPDPEQGVS